MPKGYAEGDTYEYAVTAAARPHKGLSGPSRTTEETDRMTGRLNKVFGIGLSRTGTHSLSARP